MRAEKEQLLDRIKDLELQKTTLEEGERKSQVQKAELREHITSLIAALEETKEQQVSVQSFKEHILAQRAKMLQLQMTIEEYIPKLHIHQQMVDWRRFWSLPPTLLIDFRTSWKS